MNAMLDPSRRTRQVLILVLSLIVVCSGRRAGMSTAQAPQMPLPRSLAGATVEADSRRPPDLPVVGPWMSALETSWYRYQGESNSGPYANNNCGPTCVAMAIQFTQDGRRVPIRDIRSHIGGTSWTYPSHLQSALRHWDVPHARLYHMQDIHDAVAVRGSIVIVHVWMHWFAPGGDYLVPYSDPAQHRGRYYAYTQSHWIVFHGLTQDGEWAICHDPNAWERDGRYWYAGNRPKGENRHYRYSELAASAADYDFQAIEVFAPETPTATPSPSPSATPRMRVDLPLVLKPKPPTPTPSITPTVTAQPTLPPSTIPAPTATFTSTLAPTVPLPTATDEASSLASLSSRR